jgi:release factor glutamine methyltransferase
VNKTNTEQWTTRTLLEWMSERFENHNIDSPRLISEMLMSHVLGGQRIDLYAHVDRIASEEELVSLRSFVKRTLDNEPVQFIVGKVWFFGAEFNVNPSTLIPRTCTETIIEQAVHHCKSVQGSDSTFRIADIGTGSGCIAITIANTLPNCVITATDISEDALALALDNAKLHGVEDQITFIHGDGTDPLQPLEPFDVICSNPPYIPDHEFTTLDANVRDWEPKIALSGGQDGLQVIRPLIEAAPDCLVSNGVLLMEIATSIKDQVVQLAQSSSSLRDEAILKDQFGDDRFLRATKI